MRRLPWRNLGIGVYHIYNRCANNLWILDSPGQIVFTFGETRKKENNLITNS